MQSERVLTLYAVRIAAIAAIGGFLFGFDMAVINGAVIALQHKFEAGAWETGLAVSLTLIGAASGAFFGGRFAGRFGQKLCMFWAAVLFFVNAIGSGASFGIYDFIVWRVIGGIGVGAASVIVPQYIAETAPSDRRGRLGTFQQFAIVIGIFTAALSNYFIAKYSGGAENYWWFKFEAWRWMFWVESIPAFLYGVLLMTLPESPHFLVAKNRVLEAEKVLKNLIKTDKVKTKIQDIQKTILIGRSSRILDIFCKNEKGKMRLYPVVVAGLTIAALQQFVGINVIFYYGNTLWQSVGFREEQSLILSVLSSVINVLAMIIAIFLIDKVGRKPLLLIGSAGMFVSLATMAFVFTAVQIDTDGVPVLRGISAYTAVVLANIYVIFFGMSWGPVMWVMLGEMFNNRIRTAALAVAGLVQWLANFTVSTTFPSLVKGIGLGGSYGIYAFFAIFSFFFVLNKVQETKGKELEDM
ncbi:MAG: sugar porter family MFS transporter [Chitinispirillales bacterium]|jgi:sugar porter (SP) family MFS transporter|nr:sugar porter family MFS transporter [Chitinispirillales bacterium]